MTVAEPSGAGVRRALGWSAVNNVSLRLGNMLLGVVVARLLVPEDFGVFAVALVVWSLLGSLAEFGLGADLVRSPDAERRAPTVATLALAAGLTLALLMFSAAPALATGMGESSAADAIRLMSVSLVISGMSVVPAAFLQRRFAQSRLFITEAVGLAVSTVVVIALAREGHGAMALAWSRIAAQLVTVFLHYFLAARMPRLGWDAQVARQSVRFGLPLALANLLSWLVITVDNMVIARTSGVVALGLYVLAFNVSNWPINAVGQTVRVVALPAFSRLEGGRRRQALLSATAMTWSAGLLVGAPLALLATPLITVVYGEKWAAAAAALAGLGVFGAVRVVFDLLATYLVAAGRTREVLAVQVLWLVALVPALLVGIRLGGLSGAGWAHVAVALLVVLPAYLLAIRREGVAIGRMFIGLLPATAAAIPAALAALYLQRSLSSPLSALAAGGAAFAVTYAGLILRWARRQAAVLSDSPIDHALFVDLRETNLVDTPAIALPKGNG